MVLLHCTKDAKRGGGATAAATSFRVKMREDEALKILDIEKSNLTKDYVEKVQDTYYHFLFYILLWHPRQQFKKFFDINDPKKGGSFYIQSKIFRAKEALLQKEERDGNPKPQSWS